MGLSRKKRMDFITRAEKPVNRERLFKFLRMGMLMKIVYRNIAPAIETVISSKIPKPKQVVARITKVGYY